jgi:hypothetical protein
MPSPKKNVAYTFYIALVDVSTGDFKANPTLAAGDFKVSTDGSAFTNLATLPIVDPTGSTGVKVSLSASEMNGDKILIQCIDVAGSEWSEAIFFIDIDEVNIEDVVRSATPANELVVSAAGAADSDVQQLGGSATALTRLATLYEGAVASGTVNTVTSPSDFTLTSGELSAFSNDYDSMWLVLTDGNNKFIPRLIGDYTGGTQRVQFTGGGLAGAFPQSVNPGDGWMIIAGSL